MQDVENIFWRLRWLFEVKTDKELAVAMNVPYKTLNGWKDRKSIPTKRLIDVSQDNLVSLEWLLDGKGNYSDIQNSVIVNGSNSGNIVNSHQHKVSSELMEFIELFEEYGNNKILQEFKDKLLKIKEVTQ
ncbi:putative transcriptional regulator [Campylobacter pinnipediorum subsp. caledonicus]|uniref:Putative transcriptional regulator n=1 Tax=Campylobacter pinnipediorum subsp. caledonicus TaxID=1874362 RepID=A0A1S6U5Z5_9BACT|nr:helix-turn-helix domain-containing protein [Campylobacter pinnipediorum]AQW87112.1 putative transcriptional regulator [Campylobacter pinnipediorum subsp. caledonicus]